MLKIENAAYQIIVAQGRAGKPLEICGLLAGVRDGDQVRVLSALPVESDDQSELTYTLNAQGYMNALKEAKAQNLEIVGIYHTHPATQAYPSKTDVARAHWGETDDLLFPEYSYLIVSLRDPQNPEPHSYKINGRRIPEDIVEEEVQVV